MLSDTEAFVWPVRVYWEDTDAGGVVYYANYLRFMERARSEWLRQRGLVQSTMAEDIGAILVVTSLQCNYLKPARLDDELAVSVELTRLGKASMQMAQQVRRCRDDELLLSGEVKAACLDAESWSPRRFPDRLAMALGGLPQK
jgi:acyl-CoA thioester hydrolase